MDCPCCNIELKKKMVDVIEIDECERCKGLWFENDELRKANQQLEGKCHELERNLRETKKSLNLLESERSEWMNGQKDKEDQIRTKVSSLLKKLDEWEE